MATFESDPTANALAETCELHLRTIREALPIATNAIGKPPEVMAVALRQIAGLLVQGATQVPPPNATLIPAHEIERRKIGNVTHLDKRAFASGRINKRNSIVALAPVPCGRTTDGEWASAHDLNPDGSDAA